MRGEIEDAHHSKLNKRSSSDTLIVEKIASDESFDIVVRDGKTGFVFSTLKAALLSREIEMFFNNI